MILIGSILLSLPFADKAGRATAYSDALFTATLGSLRYRIKYSYYGYTLVIFWSISHHDSG
jgi:hypothetical protein